MIVICKEVDADDFEPSLQGSNSIFKDVYTPTHYTMRLFNLAIISFLFHFSLFLNNLCKNFRRGKLSDNKKFHAIHANRYSNRF